jgi:Uma2 family endonuclease
MPALLSAPCRSLVLDDVDWKTYTRLLRIFADRRAMRLTYDRGRLEIMSPRPEHEYDNHLLDRFIIVLTEELGFTIKSGGSTTFRRRSKKRGLEPDNCYWIASEQRIRGKRRLNLKIDPPPDLAVEIDLTSSCLNRLGIYAALKVPEVWRVDSGSIAFLILGPKGKYAAGTSLSFPGVQPGDLLPFLALQTEMDDNAIVRRFRKWVRRRIAQDWK